MTTDALTKSLDGYKKSTVIECSCEFPKDYTKDYIKSSAVCLQL